MKGATKYAAPSDFKLELGESYRMCAEALSFGTWTSAVGQKQHHPKINMQKKSKALSIDLKGLLNKGIYLA